MPMDRYLVKLTCSQGVGQMVSLKKEAERMATLTEGVNVVGLQEDRGWWVTDCTHRLMG